MPPLLLALLSTPPIAATEAPAMQIDSQVGILAVLTGICAAFFWLGRQPALRRFFQYAPPLIFIYLLPVVLAQTGVLAAQSPVYDAIGDLVLPVMLVLLLVNVDVRGAVRVLGRGVAVMLFGTAGVVIGAPLAFLLAKPWLEPGAWKAFGVLSGSWIGGTGNMAAIKGMIGATDAQAGLAVLGDATIYMLWLPLLLASKNFADRFAKFSGVAPDRLAQMQAAAADQSTDRGEPKAADYLSLLAVALAATWLADVASAHLPEWPRGVEDPVLSAATWKMLLVTSLGLALSFTPARKLAGSHELGMALVYLFVARMGAKTALDELGQAIPFVLAAGAWIMIHGAFCLLGAKLLKVDIHTAAIASAANIGGPASASVVASHHEESLVPAGVLMGLLGYALGNFAGYLTALLCRWVA